MISDVRGIKERELWDGVPSGLVGQWIPKRGTVTEFQKREARCLINKLIF